MITGIKIPKVNAAIAWARRYTGSIKVSFRTAKDLRVDGVKVDGYLTRDGDRYYVYLNRDSKTAVLIDTIIHELGHLYNWERKEEGENHFEEHGEQWGKEYARAYQDYWQWRESEERKKKVKKCH
jgi:hypothetical protein